MIPGEGEIDMTRDTKGLTKRTGSQHRETKPRKPIENVISNVRLLGAEPDAHKIVEGKTE